MLDECVLLVSGRRDCVGDKNAEAGRKSSAVGLDLPDGENYLGSLLRIYFSRPSIRTPREGF